MQYVPRRIEPVLRRAARDFPAVILTGPRRSGKTTVLRKVFPRASYVLLEDPDVLSRVKADPRGFLEGLKLPVVLDEIQNAPEILGFIRTLVDASPRSTGKWILTGSQEAPLMRGVSESLAGRTAVLQLWPLSVEESPKVSLLRGGFPEVLARPRSARTWFSSYVQTYLERDVRAVAAIRDLGSFRRFLGLVATRHGQTVNRTDLAAPLGVSVPTISSWLDILELTGQVLLLPPYFENFGKRLVKSPKLYLADAGLACFLLGIDTEKQLDASPFLGPVFEGYVASEIVKSQLSAGKRRELYHFRDQKGLEVDFVVPTGEGTVALVEAKATRTVRPELARSLVALGAAAGGVRPPASFVVHRGSAAGLETKAVRPGVKSVSLSELLAALH
ncbi:MAG TPA: ATP-binding protein [Thermoanaerobaculia bacterium]|nr:ATP-binding protein [Thermoanaerobaculia bacterium]